MKYIKPRKGYDQKTPWRVSKHTLYAVRYYAQYVNRPEDEVVDRFLKNLLDDPDFLEWVHSKRRNKRMLAQLFPDDQDQP